MKLIVSIILIFLISCKNNQEKKDVDKTTFVIEEKSIEQKTDLDSINSFAHQVIKIDSIGNVYLVYTNKNGKYYKILSDKNNSVNKCNKVIVGHYYDLKVKSVFPKTSFKKPYFGILYNEQEIEIERDSINDLHFAENLRGLCIEDI